MVRKLLLCIVLAGLCVGAMRGTGKLLRSKEPFVDFSKRVQTDEEPSLRFTGEHDRLRFAVATMVSAEATFSMYRRLVQRVCRDVGRRAAFIVPPSYADVRWQLEQAEVDVALVCTGTYLHSTRGKGIKLLVQPEFENGLEYRSLFIVPAQSRFKTLDDLRGTVMACNDPESNTGCLVPCATLAKRGYAPKSFFRKVVFTGSHDRSILAVALGAVDGAAVDSLVWESNIRLDPSLEGRVRVIWQSEPFGPPPIVVPKGLDESLERSLREALLSLDKDEEGREILSSIGIKRFVPARPECYRSAVEMFQGLERRGDFRWR